MCEFCRNLVHATGCATYNFIFVDWLSAAIFDLCHFFPNFTLQCLVIVEFDQVFFIFIPYFEHICSIFIDKDDHHS